MAKGAMRTHEDRLAMLALCMAAAVFFWRVLFTSRYLIPWDFRAFHLPMAAVIFDALKHGGSLLWDPYTYCGRPFFADPQVQIFYPPTMGAISLAALLGWPWLVHLLEWEVVAHAAAAGVFTYLLLRRLSLSPPAAMAGGLVFELGGFFSSQTQHPGVIEGAAWMPLMWLAAAELRGKVTGRWIAVFGIAGALSILAGPAPIATTAFASTAIFALVLRVPWRAAAALCGGALLAVGLSAAMLAPALQLTFLSVAQYRTDWFDGRGLAPRTLLTLLLPPARGRVTDLLYCGLGGIVLAILALLRKPSRRAALPLAIVTIASGVWMFGTLTPFGRAIWWLTPRVVRGSLYPYYAMAPFCLGIGALAALGLDAMPRLRARGKYAIAALLAADLIVSASGLPMNAVDTRTEPGMTREQIDGSPATLRALHALVDGIPPARTDTHASAEAFSTTAPLTQIPSANGYNPMTLERVIQARLAFAKGYRWGAWYEVENPGSAMADAMSIRYLFSGRAIDVPRYVLRAELPGFRVYENTAARPRFWLAHKIDAVPTPEAAFARVHRPDFSPERPVVENFGGAVRPASGAEQVRVERYEARDVAISVDASAPAFLASSEVHYPGWRAAIDGRPVAIFMTDAAFRGVAVPAGHHRVEFHFAPLILPIGVAVSAFFLILAGALLALRPL